jgi:hypothetical protein
MENGRNDVGKIVRFFFGMLATFTFVALCPLYYEVTELVDYRKLSYKSTDDM